MPYEGVALQEIAWCWTETSEVKIRFRSTKGKIDVVSTLCNSFSTFGRFDKSLLDLSCARNGAAGISRFYLPGYNSPSSQFSSCLADKQV